MCSPQRWLTLLLLLFGSLTSTVLYAVPGVDFSVNASRWDRDYAGQIGQGANTATLDALGFTAGDSDYIAMVLRHPVPLLPNVRLQRTDLATTVTGTALSFQADDITFTGSVTTALDLSHEDVTLFYSPISNWVTLDVGLTARHFDGKLAVTGTDQDTSLQASETIELDEWIPFLYLAAQVELPLTGFYLDVGSHFIRHDGNSLKDFAGAIGYKTQTPGAQLSIELGHRTFTLDADDINDVQGSVDIDGMYVSIGLIF